MAEQSLKQRAIVENYEAFEAMLSLLLQDHKGEFALLYDRKVVDFFPSASAAQRAGTERYPDGLFSVQIVEEKTIDLGFYSYARYRRVA